VSKLDQIEASLRDCKYQRAQDMISHIKEAIYDTMELGQRNMTLYPFLSQVIKDSNILIESYKLVDKSIFSQISQVNQQIPSTDNNYRRELKMKEKKIKELEDKFKKINQKKPDGKPGQAKKPAAAKSSDASSKAGALSTPAQNLNEKPLTVEERDNLIKQISSLN